MQPVSGKNSITLRLRFLLKMRSGDDGKADTAFPKRRVFTQTLAAATPGTILSQEGARALPRKIRQLVGVPGEDLVQQ